MREPATPQHVAIIMDGNNRWGVGKKRLAGHKAGADALKHVIRRCIQRRVSILSVFAFSSENWSRPKFEVDGLMRLLEKSLINEVPELIENRIAVEVIGDRSRFSRSLQEAMDYAEVATKAGERLKLNVLANYGGRWDIADTARRMAKACLSGALSLDSFDEHSFDQYQNLAGQPPVDLVIRTGGEKRISNFLLWQSAYAELVFSDLLWPNFDREAFDACLDEYARRDRRFGLTSDQIRDEIC